MATKRALSFSTSENGTPLGSNFAISSRFLDIQTTPAVPSELAHQPDHLVLLLARDFGEHRQAQDRSLVRESVRELLGPVLVAAVGRQERQRRRIIDARLHAIRIEMRGERIAARMTDG